MNQLEQRCPECGKPTAVRQRGSLTAWLFNQTECNCRQPSKQEQLPVTAQSESNIDRSESNLEHISTKESPDFHLVGQIIDNRYEVQALIGRGGMGSVYRVLDKSSDSVRAMKLINKDADRQDALEKRLENEAQAIGSLSHPNIVAIHDSGKAEDGSPFLTMDYIDGRSLEDVLKTAGALDQERALNIFIQIAESLAHAHSKGVVHRDLKPSNVLIVNDENGNDLVKIVDFGIAKIFDENMADKDKLTQTGELIGSPLYMSPEQCKGDKLSARSDIYSLACIMYETLSGQPPFQAENPVRVLMKHISETPAPLPNKLRINPGLSHLILRCLAKDPLDRYANSETLVRDLKLLRDGRKIGINLPGIVPKLLEKDPRYRYQSADEFASDLKALRLFSYGDSRSHFAGIGIGVLILCGVGWILCDAPGTNFFFNIAANSNSHKQAEWHLSLARFDKNLHADSLAGRHALDSSKMLQSYFETTADLGQAETAVADLVALENEFSLPHGNDTSQYLTLGDRLVRAGRSREALEAYTKGWQLDKLADSRSVREKLLSDLNAKSKRYQTNPNGHKKEQTIAAEIVLLRALTLCRSMAGDTSKDGPYQILLITIYNRLGWLYFEQKRFDDEISMFQQTFDIYAVKADPKKTAFRMYTLALGYRHAERLEQAEEWFKKAEKCASDAADKWVQAVCSGWLADLASQKGDFVSARTLATKALLLIRSHPPIFDREYTLPGQVFRECATAYETMGDVVSEEHAYQQGLDYLSAEPQTEKSPSWPIFFDNYAKFLRSKPNREGDAEKMVQRAANIRNAVKDDTQK